jgi:HD-GYP domain-containing protein (c-di-GMP phosphodiesterase class II)
MTYGRLYRAPLSREEARAEIERSSGTQFDPQVVRAFSAAIGAGQALAV